MKTAKTHITIRMLVAALLCHSSISAVTMSTDTSKNDLKQMQAAEKARLDKHVIDHQLDAYGVAKGLRRLGYAYPYSGMKNIRSGTIYVGKKNKRPVWVKAYDNKSGQHVLLEYNRRRLREKARTGKDVKSMHMYDGDNIVVLAGSNGIFKPYHVRPSANGRYTLADLSTVAKGGKSLNYLGLAFSDEGTLYASTETISKVKTGAAEENKKQVKSKKKKNNKKSKKKKKSKKSKKNKKSKRRRKRKKKKR